MNEKDFIRKLGSRARMETPPSVNVADRVLRTVGDQYAAPAFPYRPLAWMAGFSAATAAIGGIMIFSHQQSLICLLKSLYFYSSLSLL